MEHRFKKKPHFKMLSLFLALILCLGLWMPVTAQEAAEPEIQAETTLPAEPEISVPAENGEKAEEQKPIDPTLVPAVVGQTRAEERAYVARAYDLEPELNEVALKRADGKVDIYTYSFPVKYEVNGVQYDKNPQLTAAGRGFVSDKNTDLALTCGATAAEGFTLRGNGLDLSLRPLSLADYRALGGKSEDQADTFRNGTAKKASVQSPLTEEAVTVPAAAYEIGADTVLSIVPGYIGAHLTLTRSEKSAPAAFFFRLETHGLKLEEGDGALMLLQDGQPVAMIGCPTDERTDELQPYTLTQANDGSYLLRVEANGGQNLLLSAVQYYDYLQDVTIYSNSQQSYNQGQGIHLYAGRDTGVLMERILIRPNSWSFTASAYPNYYVESAKVILRDVMANNTGNIECRQFTGNNWQESTAYWNLVNGGSYGALYDTVQVTPSGTNTGTAHYFGFNVTSSIRAWYQGSTAWQKGVLFRWTNEAGSTYKEFIFASVQYTNNTNYRPKFEITVTPQLPDGIYYIRNRKYFSAYLTANSTVGGSPTVCLNTLQTSGNNYCYEQLWRVKNIGGRFYTVRPMHFTPMALYAVDGYHLYTANAGTWDQAYGSENYSITWEITYDASTLCYNITNYDEYGDNPIHMVGPYRAANQSISYPAEVDGLYDFYGDPCEQWFFTAANNAPERIFLYDSNTGERYTSMPTIFMTEGAYGYPDQYGLAMSISRLSYIAPYYLSTSFTDASMFDIYDDLYTMVNGQGLTTVTLKWNSTDANAAATFRISSLETLVEPGIYLVKSKDTGGYLDISDDLTPNNELWINQQEFTGNTAQRWEFEYLSDGYYTIRSKSSTADYYLGVSGDGTPTDTPVALRTPTNNTFTDGMKWKISTTTSGAYKITPKTGETNDRVLAVSFYVPLFGIGTKVRQRDYVDDANYKDEWILKKMQISYLNYYDSTFANSPFLIESIYEANSFSDYVYNKLCGVHFVINGIAKQKTDAIADQCSHLPNIPCSDEDCGANCALHHRNGRNISDQLYYGDNTIENQIQILWSNRSPNTYCSKTANNTHLTRDWIAVVYDDRPVIHFMTIYGETNNIKKACLTLNIIHETAHSLGMSDVYETPGHDVQDGYVCVMEYFEESYAYGYYQSILDGDSNAFCTTCTLSVYQCMLNKMNDWNN